MNSSSVASSRPIPSPQCPIFTNASDAARHANQEIKLAKGIVLSDVQLKAAADHRTAHQISSGEIVITKRPKLLSREEILADPEQYKRENKGKILEIVLTDVDGTTRHGQFWLQCLVDALRFGPMASTGLGFDRAFDILGPSLLLRGQEILKGEADPEETRQVTSAGIKGLDMKKVEASLQRFHDNSGDYGLSPSMKAILDFHVASERLVIGISASPQKIVRLHAQKLGLPIGNFFGTTLDVDENGIATGDYQLLRAQAKVEFLEKNVFSRLKDAGIKFKVVYAYADAPSDVPLLEIAYKNGGIPVSVNSPWGRLDTPVQEMGGMVLKESKIPFRLGKRTLLCGTFSDEAPLPQQYSPFWNDVTHYLTRPAVCLMPLNLGYIASNLMPSDILPFENVAGIAVGAAMAGVAELFIPKVGNVSFIRKSFLRDFVPLFSAMYFGYSKLPSSPMGAVLFGTSLLMTLVITKPILHILKSMALDLRKTPQTFDHDRWINQYGSAAIYGLQMTIFHCIFGKLLTI